ncbi:hypothetical protein [Actinoplanes subglobosus]|uniref:Uncharacterized protein n=1 Tax=Actinoplanes subglobosus TaxID=1547892 RepID=A0ABV8J5D6_9ACTN
MFASPKSRGPGSRAVAAVTAGVIGGFALVAPLPAAAAAGQASGTKVGWNWSRSKNSDSVSECSTRTARISVSYSGEHRVVLRLKNNIYSSSPTYADVKAASGGYNTGYLHSGRPYSSGVYTVSTGAIIDTLGVGVYDSADTFLSSAAKKFSVYCGYTYTFDLYDTD